jgi:hypothetical protein
MAMYVLELLSDPQKTENVGGTLQSLLPNEDFIRNFASYSWSDYKSLDWSTQYWVNWLLDEITKVYPDVLFSLQAFNPDLHEDHSYVIYALGKKRATYYLYLPKEPKEKDFVALDKCLLLHIELEIPSVFEVVSGCIYAPKRALNTVGLPEYMADGYNGNWTGKCLTFYDDGSCELELEPLLRLLLEASKHTEKMIKLELESDTWDGYYRFFFKNGKVDSYKAEFPDLVVKDLK